MRKIEEFSAEWEIEDDANELISVPREESYPYRLIITQEQINSYKKLNRY